MQIQIKKIYYNGHKHLKNTKSNNFYNNFSDDFYYTPAAFNK